MLGTARDTNLKVSACSGVPESEFMAFQTDLLLTWLNCDQLPNYRCAEHY